MNKMRLGTASRSRENTTHPFRASTKTRLVTLALAVGAVGLVPAAGAAAGAVITDFVVVHEPETFTAPAFFCLPEDLVGTVVMQEISSGRAVEAPGGNFVLTGLDEFTYRVDFPDGSYVESGINRDHFHVVANGHGDLFTRVTQDFETIYDSSGEVVGKIALNGMFVTSWHDTNRDGVPDAEELTTQVEKFRIRCQ